LDYLDGLRGVAALIVVVFHFFSAYLPTAIPAETPRPWRISDTPLGILYNGLFSVIVFFVLSGFVVSNSAAKKRDHLLLNLVLRYKRLALPATASVLWAWLLLKLFPDKAAGFAGLIPHDWLQFTYQGKIPSLCSAFSEGLVHIFTAGSSLFNNVLWTMKVELIGSCFIYILYSFARGRTLLRALILLALILPAVHQIIYEGFVFGAILRELWVADRLLVFFPIQFFALGALLGSVSQGFHSRMHLPRMPPLFTIGDKSGILYPIGAAMIVYGCLASSRLQALFSIFPARFLGRISFCLYLFHVPLLYTVFAAIYLAQWPVSPPALSAVFLIFMCVSVGISYVGTVFVDEPVLRLNAGVRRIVRDRMSAGGTGRLAQMRE
jgi:peptidoglycan/LPS O-acetylase OafA/YrhL